MKLPWKSKPDGDRLVVCSTADAFAYVQAQRAGPLQRCGLERRGSDSAADFARRVRALGLPARDVTAVLPLADAQLLQVEAPAVKPEEMKAAARWRIKDLVDARLDDLTIDVMTVGDDRPRTQRQLFVAAARNTTIRSASEFTEAAGLKLSVIDLMETSQRNLLSAVATSHGLGERATAGLMLHGSVCLLTICARGELFYARRLDWDANDLAGPAAGSAIDVPAVAETPDFVDYGAEIEQAQNDGGDVLRIVIELQRSFDVWERSWPELPLAGLWVQVGEPSVALASALEHSLGMQVGVLHAESVFPGWEAMSGDAATCDAVLPLLGALLRSETRQL